MHLQSSARVIAIALALAGCGSPTQVGGDNPSTSASPAPSITSAMLLPYAVTGTDLGAGWTQSIDPTGQSLNVDNQAHPCARTYPSDALRLARTIVVLNNTNSPSQVGDEVTAYRPGGASQALADARRVAASCPSYVQRTTDGQAVTIEVHLSNINPSVGAERVVIERRASLQGRTLYSVIFMVRVNDYVSTVFTVSGDAALAGQLAGRAASATAGRLNAAPSLS